MALVLLDNHKMLIFVSSAFSFLFFSVLLNRVNLRFFSIMFSSNSNPCASYLSSSSNQYYSRPANCYRPLQQLYKTVNSSCDCDKTLSSSSRTAAGKAGPMQIACICRPAERYKTTNMTYGSFYYENSLSTEKNQVINYDKAIFARCYDQNKINMANTSTKDKNCTKE